MTQLDFFGTVAVEAVAVEAVAVEAVAVDRGCSHAVAGGPDVCDDCAAADAQVADLQAVDVVAPDPRLVPDDMYPPPPPTPLGWYSCNEPVSPGARRGKWFRYVRSPSGQTFPTWQARRGFPPGRVGLVPLMAGEQGEDPEFVRTLEPCWMWLELYEGPGVSPHFNPPGLAL